MKGSLWHDSRVLLFACFVGTVALDSRGGDFKPIGSFVASLPQDMKIDDAGGNSEVSAQLAQAAASGFLRNYAIVGISGINKINHDSFTPIQSALNDVHDAQMRSDRESAAKAASEALAKLNDLDKGQSLKDTVHTLAPATGASKAIEKLGMAFLQYILDLRKSVKEAQNVPQAIDTFVKNNVAGERILGSAWTFTGKAYTNGMQCNNLVSKAAEKAGVKIVTKPLRKGQTVTQSWFENGMGPELPQIYGGDKGITLSQLAADVASDKFKIPIGTFIIADGTPHGHAGLFAGTAQIKGTTQLITFDANESDGWVVCIDGKVSKDSDACVQKSLSGMPMLSFPGKSVGIHVTSLQWKTTRLVKMFQPIGNHQ